MPLSHKKIVAISALLAVLTFCAYQGLQKNEFVNFDDNGYVDGNSHVLQGLTWENVGWAFTTLSAANWHPLTWISHMVDVQLFGLNPAAHHLVNLTIHCLNVILLFLLLWRMTGAVWKSAMVAALFAVHPVNVESVAWLAERKNVLSTLFWIVTMRVYISYVRSPTTKHYLEVIIAYAIGLMAKPMMVTGPFVLLLLDFWPLRRFSFAPGSDEISTGSHAPIVAGQARKGDGEALIWPRRKFSFLVTEKVPLFVLSVASSVVTYAAQARGEVVATFHSAPLIVRLGNSVTSYVMYIYRMIWPVHLAIIYPFRSLGVPLWEISVATLVLVACTGVVLWRLQREPYLAVGWFWFLGTLVPVIGLVQVGQQANADRYEYVPLVGLFIALVWGIAELCEKYPPMKAWAVAAAVVVLLAFSLKTHKQITYWHDTNTLFQHALDVTDDNYVAHTDLGVALEAAGDQEGALKQYMLSLAIKPSSLYSATLYQVGQLKLKQKKIDEALYYLQEALKYPATTRWTATIRQMLGSAWEQKGNYQAAEDEYRKVIAANPSAADSTRLEMGMMLLKEKHYADAEPLFVEILKSGPDASVYYLLGKAQEGEGKAPQAAESFRQALRQEPNYILAEKELKIVLAGKATR